MILAGRTSWWLAAVQAAGTPWSVVTFAISGIRRRWGVGDSSGSAECKPGAASMSQPALSIRLRLRGGPSPLAELVCSAVPCMDNARPS